MRQRLMWLAAATLLGCAGQDPPPGTRLDTAAGNYRVTVAFEPDPIPRNQHFSVLVTVQDRSGDPVPGDVGIGLDADMPAHRHGMNTQPVVARLGPGRFRADGLLWHMAGEWELTIDVIAGAARERATLTVEVR